MRDEERERKLAARRMSPLARKLTFPYGVKLAYVIFYLTTFAMALPYFRYFVTGAPVHGSSHGSKWVLDPTKEGYTLLWPFVIMSVPLLVALVMRPFATRDARRRMLKEETWLATLPFPIVGYPQLVGADSRYRHIEIQYLHTPDHERLQDIIRGIDSRLDCRHNSNIITLDLKLENAHQAGCLLFDLVRPLCEVVLLKMLAEYPIHQVVITD